MNDAQALKIKFERYLMKQRLAGTPENLYQPFDYMLSLPAKRLRPVLVMMACEMFGLPADKALPQALAVELFHNFTLIHDDIMDQAPVRRGMKTVHEKYGQTTAILSGDAMLVFAFRYLVKAETNLLPELLRIFSETAIDVCEGQQLDMNYENEERITVNQYVRMIGLKTASLIAASLRLGAAVAKAKSRDALDIARFGKELGIVFQLQDDWLDAYGEAHKVGKMRGGDIAQRKKTLLILAAMQKLDADGRQKLWKLYHSDAPSRVEKVLRQFDQLRIRDVTAKMIRSRYLKALTFLDHIKMPESNKLPLRKLADSLFKRES
jgi:geranylgeranyl diphosphate synthase type II